MITVKKILQKSIDEYNQVLKNEKFEELDRKQLMRDNSWETLPQNLLYALYSRSAYQQMMNIMESWETAEDPVFDKSKSNLQKIEYIMARFMSDFWTWVEENQVKYDVDSLVFSDAFRELTTKNGGVNKEEVFKYLVYTAIMAYSIEEVHKKKG